jgi:hypothetical protein
MSRRANTPATLNAAFLEARAKRVSTQEAYYAILEKRISATPKETRFARLELQAAEAAEAKAWDAYYKATTTPAQRRHAEDQARQDRARRR